MQKSLPKGGIKLNSYPHSDSSAIGISLAGQPSLRLMTCGCFLRALLWLHASRDFLLVLHLLRVMQLHPVSPAQNS